MLKVSKRLHCALKLMLFLAGNKSNIMQPTATIANKLQVSMPFLHQIVNLLMRHGLVITAPGPRGGIRLAQPANNITLLQIVESVEGKFTVSESNFSDKTITNEQEVANVLWEDIGKNICGCLDSITLADLIGK